ncbi:pyridoxal phosphate-dependent decarboxylase family protein [Bacteroidota bacterium]
MDNNEFRKQAHQMADRIADYFDEIEKYNVKSQVKPGDIFNQLPDIPPKGGESFDDIMKDFENIIMPGITHWQHPKFHAYFPANNSYPSVLGEMLTSALGAQCMMWETSPAAAELEEKMMIWLRDMIGLSKEFSGVIQDTASTATLCAILTAREYYSNYKINEEGFNSAENYRIYCSSEAHSSIEKAVKIAGIGLENLVKIPVDDKFQMIPDELNYAIILDIQKGFRPLCIIDALGTTGCTAVDPLEEIGKIAKEYDIWLHVDAAYAGTALILPEMRHYLEGIEYADSFVFNPHKWMFTNFDCSAYFVRDKEALIRTFEIMPEYLKTKVDDHVNNYRDWGIALGRRFRALKLWFVLRTFGVKGLQEKVREHICIANKLMEKIENHPNFEILAPVPFNVICFRYKPKDFDTVGTHGNVPLQNDNTIINKINEELLNKINSTGKAYLTHTKLNGKYAIRFVVAQTNVEERDVMESWELILSLIS